VPAGSAAPSAGAPSAEPLGPAGEPSSAASPVVEPSAAGEAPAGPTSVIQGAPGQAQPPPTDASPVADLDPAVGLSLIVALLGVLAVTVMVLRRGRSGVGL
jgi:hypothetical protein